MAGRIIAVTGAEGFVGRNLVLRLGEGARYTPRPIARSSSAAEWRDAIAAADAVIHLAGVNRPADPQQFEENATSVSMLRDAIAAVGRPVPVILASSLKATDATPYGISKKAAETAAVELGRATASPVAIYRLPNVFGKWCRPNYNSAVATFCHNIARDLPIEIHDPSVPLRLVYVDDLIDTFLAHIEGGIVEGFHDVEPTYSATVGELAAAIRGFREDRYDNLIAEVGSGLVRALYATYVSYLPPEQFSYGIASHGDPRGSFSEMLKTRTSGQFSYFTAHPGVTRGGHYHHTKTEKFLIVHGEALFRFRHMLTGETHEVRTSADQPQVVETIPGWAHDVTNVGDTVMVSLLWANEIFDRARPDTISAKV